MDSKDPDDGQSELNRDKTTCRMSAIDAEDKYFRDCSECLHTANWNNYQIKLQDIKSTSSQIYYDLCLSVHSDARAVTI